jgi:hypothetical protein
MTSGRRLPFMLLLGLLLPLSARAGAWVQDLGKIYAKISYGASSANSFDIFLGVAWNGFLFHGIEKSE